MSELVDLRGGARRDDVGGKAANLARLVAAGFNVPEARAVSVAAFLAHVAACREAGASEDAALREAIVARPLEPSLDAALRDFAGAVGGRVSVRSSANLEDAHTHAFAGQFLTVLNVGPDAVADAVRRVWASAFTDHVRAYLERGGLDRSALAMAVVVQRQLDSRVSGVVMGDADRAMIESVFGQGEAVVSAEVETDHWDLQHGRIVARRVATKGWRVTLPDGPPSGELTRSELPEALRDQPSLADRQVLQVAGLAGELSRSFAGRAQDCEFSFVGDELFVLQTRDVTASLPVEPPPLGPWDPPGKGGWDLDDAHFARPVSRVFSELFPPAMMQGFRESLARYGALLSHLDLTAVNRFIYTRPRPVAAPEDAASRKPPPRLLFKLMTKLVPELRRRIRTAELLWKERTWRKDVEAWERDKQAAIAKHLELQGVDMTALDGAALARHLRAVAAHAVAMVTQHHRYNFATLVPTGDLLAHAQMYSDGRLAAADVLALLRGSSEASADLRSPDARRLACSAHDHAEARRLLGLDGDEASSDIDAAQRLQALCALDGEPGAAARDFLAHREFRLVEGLDPVSPCLREIPKMLWRAARDACRATDDAGQSVEADAALQAKIDEAIPPERRASFDAVLAEARATYYLRDERALYSDVWAWGILRSVYLEVGTRLLRRKPPRIVEAQDVMQAGVDELESLLLRGEGPSAEELRQRDTFQRSYTVADAPPRLGPPPEPPPPLEWLPPGAARVSAAIGAVMATVLPPRTAPVEGSAELAGRPASGGVYEGPAHVIASPNDIEGVTSDAVLVVGASSSAFTMLAPLAAAVVAEGGGLLSHVAIVCREYRIPCVVGCAGVLERVENGDRLRIDGTRGTVTLLGSS